MTRTMLRIALALALAAPATALAERSEWSMVDSAKLRLLIAGPRDDGIAAGVEILLDPGWHTYWRNPGEAGVPPVFDFSASENVAEVTVLYPAPQRYEDGVSVSLVYLDEVVFPLIVEPIAPDRPVTLSLDMVFGVCAEICIPTRASATATLQPDAVRDPLAEARLRRFEPAIPAAPEPARFAIESVAVDDHALLIDARMPQSAYMDLFADPPEGWFIGQPAFVSRAGDISRYRLSLAGKPKDAEVIGETFRFVAVAGGEAIEQAVEIR